MKDPRILIGNFFEELVMNIFDLQRLERKSGKNLPDLVSKDGSYIIEVKASAYDNGGVINMTQMNIFNEDYINTPKFYAFCYHPISKVMKKYTSEKKLLEDLELKSLFLFPFSIVKSHFDNSNLKTNENHDSFVQLRENQAYRIFKKETGEWRRLNLYEFEYRTTILHEKVNLVTRRNNLDKKIRESFNPYFI